MVSIQIHNELPVPLVTLTGRLDTTTSAEVDQALRPILNQQKFLIIDLSQCTYLSSAGIRILLITEKRLMAGGGRLVLSGIIPEVFQVLEMAGLHQVFRICTDTGAARTTIEQLQKKANENSQWTDGPFTYHWHPIDNKQEPMRVWGPSGIVGYDELGLSIGIGSPAEAPEEDLDLLGTFVTSGRCAGFIPSHNQHPADFRTPKSPAQAGIYVHQAVSFGNQPTGKIHLTEPAKITFQALAQVLQSIRKKATSSLESSMALIVAGFNPDAPSISIILSDNGPLTGICFQLAELPDYSGGSLTAFLEKQLTIVNIVNVEPIHPDHRVFNPTVWVFMPDGQIEASSQRLKIETTDDFLFEPHKEFLTRRLYTDSAHLIIKQIHGGYSAQTYQVTSFDADHRKLRPTVLKIANRAMISRESERCQQYALPYIMNNSAIVLGTEFFGDTGALRYNFVGIGGELTQLKWLTHYYHHWSPEKLDPLFDKIFLQILHPWYGQPIQENIYPYRDHDPRTTFFPRICEIAEELFGISPDQPILPFPETSQSITNPYWFLKHQFAQQKETAIPYYTSICHGDLNMQNILLDEDMNVYLIDFSETKPRSLISDFARLEAILMVDFAPVDNDNDLQAYLKFMAQFYGTVRLNEVPVNNYQGKQQEIVHKNYSLTLKMRQYAVAGVQGNAHPAPYCLALLEWILPVVTYTSATPFHKRVSLIVSGLICNQLMSMDREM